MKIQWMEHQERALQFMDEKLREVGFAALFMETGTGKTPVAMRQLEIWTYEENLFPHLVICPNALTYNWCAEAKKFESPLRFKRIEGGRANRLSIIESDDYDVLVVNYDALRTYYPALVARKFKGVVLDELQKVKSRKAKQTKACREITKLAVYRIGLTGTPVVQSPLDLWSEFDILYPKQNHILGYGKSYSVFEHSVAEVTNHPRLGHRVKIYAYPEHRLHELKKRVAPYAFEATKDQCLDLPPRTWQTIHCEMTPEQSRLYKQMKEEAVATLMAREDCLAPEEQMASAQIVISQLVKLQQIASGFLKTDDGVIHELPNAKLDVLEEMLEEVLTNGQKTCIFTRFVHDIGAISDMLNRRRLGYVTVDGRTSKEAGQLVEQFQMDDDIRVFVGQIQVISTGLNLFRANSVFYFTNGFSFGDRAQSEDRVYRHGQTRHVTYYDLAAKGTIDLHVIKNLQAKKELARLTISDLKAMLMEDA